MFIVPVPLFVISPFMGYRNTSLPTELEIILLA
jgi:hypothetical protein